MIKYRAGDILKAETEALVNTVNCVGVMGRGIALQFKNAYPENYDAYVKACKTGNVNPGQPFVFDLGADVHPRYIVNFPTKRHCRNPSKIEDIQSGLEALTAIIQNLNIRSISIPPLGCGLGGLDWAVVLPMIQSAMEPLVDLRVAIYEPAGSPQAKEIF